MTTLEAIINRLKTTVPSWQIRVGFGTDLMEFIQQSTVVAPTIFVSVGEHIPNADTLIEAFRYERFTEHFSVFLRRGEFAPSEVGEVYQQYLSIRNALNGYAFDTTNGAQTTRRICSIESGAPLYEAGFAAAQLSIAVI